MSWGGIRNFSQNLFNIFGFQFNSWELGGTRRFINLCNSVNYCSVLWKLLSKVMCLLGGDGEVNIFEMG